MVAVLVSMCLFLTCAAASEFAPRFASDPDRVGAEKMSMTSVPKAYLESEYHELPAVIGNGSLS